MKRTSPLALVVAALLGGVVAFAADHLLTRSGGATFTPAVTLPILLVLLGAACLALAWPIRRAVSDPNAPRVDPFRSLRVAVLSKASSIVGAALGGAGLGLLAYLATRPVTPGIGSMGTIIATAAAGAVLMVAALVAEHWCTLPKDPDDREPDDPGAGAPAAH
ncbi:DUF3180 family protein [Microbacterium sediminis]|uniref:Uncharacterized protein n=1 Tax=Microbacterium sediminis TaxID=904291 RepID=A0A1B9NHQ4_9MICO|nr:DUF3180 family protein [Microbacterium sediminis]OCG76115.1 hypothetical protein A7J15_12565 [Microbacterium sediminis]QBR73313.1 DUF3180 family protein [Microbacterium sediminis]